MTIDPVTIDLIDVIDYEHGISALDSGFFRKRLDAIHFIIEDGHGTIVDTGINASVPLVLETLSTKGLRAGFPWVAFLITFLVTFFAAGFATAFLRATISAPPHWWYLRVRRCACTRSTP